MELSPIFKPTETPKHRGWYVSSPNDIGLTTLKKKAQQEGLTTFQHFWYWTGLVWYTNHPTSWGAPATIQDRYWFGQVK